MARYVVTGASRGIGLELVRQLNARGEDVIAAVRKPTGALTATGCEVARDVDVTTDKGAQNLLAALKGRGVDVLINNAGLLISDTLETLDFAAAMKQFDVNALGPLRITRALLPLMGEGGKIGFVTSYMGSIGANSFGGDYGYRMSKAAANMAAMSLAVELKKKGVAVAALHPGYVRTDMTHGLGNISPQASARGLLLRLDELDLSLSGHFLQAEGGELPW